VLAEVDADDAVGHRKVLAILHAAMADAVPPALRADAWIIRADAWIIRQNALRLLAALGAILETFAGAAAANTARRVAARIEHGVDADAVGLTAIDGVGARRARTLAAAGLADPAAVASAPLETLTDLEIAAGTAERIQTAAAQLPAVSIRFDAIPGSR
jgi:predicted flap endonuclease-1-like 5' DNA nuclease